MAGDLILASVNDSTLATLTEAGGKMGGEIFHADRFSQQNWDLLRAKALQKASVTLEVYKYDSNDLIGRTTGTVNDNLSYMKLINE